LQDNGGPTQTIALLLVLVTEVLTIPPPRLPLTAVPMRFKVPMSPLKVMLATAPSKEELPLS
jgi:hypothetical protein